MRIFSIKFKVLNQKIQLEALYNVTKLDFKNYNILYDYWTIACGCSSFLSLAPILVKCRLKVNYPN